MTEKANLTEWNRRQLWTLAEAAFLLNGREPPKAIDIEEIRGAGRNVNRVYEELKSATDLMRFQSTPPRRLPLWIGERRAEPSHIVKWAREFGFEVPAELAGMAETTKERDERLCKEVEQERGKKNPTPLKTVRERNGISESNMKRIWGKGKK